MTANKEFSKLPESWDWTTLAAVADISSGFGFPKHFQGKTEGDIPFFKVMDISKAFLNGSIYLRRADNYISFNECDDIKAKPLREGTIVFAKIGEAIKLNRRAILAQDSLVDNNVMGLKTVPEVIYNLFIFYFLNTIKFGDYSRATTVPSLRKSDVETIPVPLAPLPEQHRIVSRIEELFSRLDAGVQALRRARAQIERYRQSVLKAAVEGRLTAEWREAHPEVEPAEELLKGILTYKRSKWEEKELMKMRSRQKTPKNDRWKEKYKNPRSISVQADLPEIPANWAYTFLDPILSIERTGMKTGPFGSLLKKEEHKAEGIPVLGIENIEYMKFIRGSKIHINEKKADQLWDYDARPGDIIISRSGTVGEVCVVPEDIERAIISTNLMRVTLNSSAMLPRFFCLLLKGSPFVMSQISELCKGSTRSFLNQEILSSIVFPIGPICEQCLIVDEVERYHSYLEQLQDELRRDFVCISRLRQSILQRAFQGQLVPQDPNDEPASLLQERIRAERSKEPQRRGKKSNNHQARLAQ